MLIIESQEYFDTVKAKAVELGLEKKLQEKLDYLGGYACHETPEDTRCRLFQDRAPLSFEFVMEKRQPDGTYKRWFNGGMIFYGAGDQGFGAPQFSVRIGNLDAGWSIHT